MNMKPKFKIGDIIRIALSHSTITSVITEVDLKNGMYSTLDFTNRRGPLNGSAASFVVYESRAEFVCNISEVNNQLQKNK